MVLFGRREAILHQAAADIAPGGRDVLAVPADLTDEAALAGLPQRVLEWSGRLDILIHNAGLMRFGKLEEAGPDQ